MKTTLIIACSLIVTGTIFSQKVEFELKPEHTMGVIPYIYKDGSFDLTFDNAVYSYDADGVLLDQHLNTSNGMKEVYSFLSESLNRLIDYDNDIAYYFHYFKTKKEEKIDITIRPLGVGKENTVIKIDPDDEDNLKLHSAYFEDNGDPAFLMVGEGISKMDKNSVKSGNSSCYLKKFVLHLSTNTVEKSIILVNKAPFVNSKATPYINFLGTMAGKLIVAISSDDYWKSRKGKVSFWSVDMESGEETEIKTIDYVYDDNARDVSQSRIKVVSELSQSGLYFQIGSVIRANMEERQAVKGGYDAKAHYLLYHITPEMEVVQNELEIPTTILSVHGAAPGLFFYETEENAYLYLYASSDLLYLTYNEGEDIKAGVFPNLDKTTPQTAAVVFDPEAKNLIAGLTDPLITDPAHICMTCPPYITTKNCYRICDDNVARVIKIDFLVKSKKGILCVHNMMVRFQAEQLKD